MGTLLLAIAVAAACGPKMHHGASEVLDQLGPVAGFSGIGCQSAQAMVDAFLEEIGRKPSQPLSATVPKFAKRAAGVCPQSRPVIRVSGNADAAAVRRTLGGSASKADDAIQLANWLRADVDHGKIVSLTLDLARVSH